MRPVKRCQACKKPLSIGRETGRREVCPFCSADLHACLNCRFFDRSAPKQCRESQADLVREKDKANFCDYFVFAETAAGASATGEVAEARQALHNLFQK